MGHYRATKHHNTTWWMVWKVPLSSLCEWISCLSLFSIKVETFITLVFFFIGKYFLGLYIIILIKFSLCGSSYLWVNKDSWHVGLISNSHRPLETQTHRPSSGIRTFIIPWITSLYAHTFLNFLCSLYILQLQIQLAFIAAHTLDGLLYFSSLSLLVPSYWYSAHVSVL